MSVPSPSPATESLGLAHVATASFVGARVAPAAQFWLTLPGGVALARAAARMGTAHGYAVSLAATLQAVAILGPLRINGPLTQALSAPLIGRLEARGARPATQVLACLAVRLVHYTVLSALAIWLVLGGVDGFVRTYEAATGWLGILPQGRAGAIATAIAYQFAWAVAFSLIQVAVYRRALRAWPVGTVSGVASAPAPPVAAAVRNPWPAAIFALACYVVLLATTAPVALAVVAIALAMTLPERPMVNHTIGIVLLLAIATVVPTRLRMAGRLHRMPEYAALVRGSRRIAGMGQPMRAVRTAFPLQPTSDPEFLYKILGGRIDRNATWVATIAGDGQVSYRQITE